MFPTVSQVNRQYAFAGVIDYEATPNPTSAIIAAQVSDGLVTALSFLSTSPDDLVIDVGMYDLAGTAIILGSFPLPAPVAPAAESTVDALAALGSGFAGAIVVPTGWRVGAKIQSSLSSGSVYFFAVLGVV